MMSFISTKDKVIPTENSMCKGHNSGKNHQTGMPDKTAQLAMMVI